MGRGGKSRLRTDTEGERSNATTLGERSRARMRRCGIPSTVAGAPPSAPGHSSSPKRLSTYVADTIASNAERVRVRVYAVVPSAFLTVNVPPEIVMSIMPPAMASATV